jgi:ABC-type transport system involved in Fe-S cluster assembly fused permease/ATPase subunit
MAPNSATVAAGVAATFHLLRLTVDLVTTASDKAKSNDDKIDKADAADKEKDAAAATRGRPSIMRRLSVTGFDGRLSVRDFQTPWSSNNNSTAAADNVGRSGRRLSSMLSNSFRSSAHQAAQADDVEGQNEGLANPKGALEASIPMLSLVLHLIIFAYLLAATILTATSSVETRPQFANAMYDAVPLGCATTAVFIGILMNVRDFHRKRFGSLNRGLYSISSLILLVGCIILISLPSPDGVAASPTRVDFGTISCLAIYAVLAVIEGRVCQYPEVKTKEGKKAKLNKRALLIILKPYFWPDATATSATINRVRAITTWLCVGSAKACSLFAPILLGRASTALTRFDYATAIKNVVLYSLAQLAGSTFKECQSLIYLKVGQAAFVQISELSFNHLHSLSLDWHLRKKLGEVIRSMDRGIAACDTLMRYLFLWLVPALGECVLVTIIFATYFDFFPLAVAVFFFIFAYVTWTVLVTLWRRKFRKKVAKFDNNWHDICTDSLINFETVKYFTNEEYEMKRFGSSVEKYQSQDVNVKASMGFLNVTQQLMLQACLATCLSLAIVSIRGRMDCCLAEGCIDTNSECCDATSCSGLRIGDFISVLTYTLNLFMPLNFLGSVYNAIVMALIDLANLSELLTESPDVCDAPDAMDPPTPSEIDSDTVVEFDNVKFHYPTQPDTKGLKGLSFKMKRGTVTAVVGPTGEGKTTVSRLLFRFYDVIGGAVKVNGIDVRSLKQKSLRGAIGVVPQNTSLFNDTLKNNIKYGKQDATDDEVMQVIEDAQLKDFVDSLPEGWDTMVGDRGLKLSGGEKQRTAIARCLLKNPSIVVLDEATSALDTVTENSVQDALDRLGSDRTVLVIAHRLGTIREADNIIVLGDGVVAEQGTHDELMEREGGKYAEMWNMQLHSARGNKKSTESLTALSS